MSSNPPEKLVRISPKRLPIDVSSPLPRSRSQTKPSPPVVRHFRRPNYVRLLELKRVASSRCPGARLNTCYYLSQSDGCAALQKENNVKVYRKTNKVFPHPGPFIAARTIGVQYVCTRVRGYTTKNDL